MQRSAGARDRLSHARLHALGSDAAARRTSQRRKQLQSSQSNSAGCGRAHLHQHADHVLVGAAPEGAAVGSRVGHGVWVAGPPRARPGIVLEDRHQRGRGLCERTAQQHLRV